MLPKDRYEQFVRGESIDNINVMDTGLRQYMQGVYNYMTTGLLMTALISYLMISTGAIFMLFSRTAQGGVSFNILGYIAIFSPLALIFYFNHALRKSPISTVQAVFFLYSALVGVSLSPIIMLYTGASIVRVFLITASMFAGLSLYGYTTKKNLSGLGTFLYMGLWGLIISGIVNVFLASPAVYFVNSVAGVLIFSGLTAYDTQKIRSMYYSHDSGDTTARKSIAGALHLYLDFINMFIYLLRFFGNRR